MTGPGAPPAPDDDARARAAREGDRVTSNRASAPPGRMTEAEFRSLYERLRGQAALGTG